MVGQFTQMLRDWQTFYVLMGTASATLTGLIFIAASFGSSLVPADPTATVHTWVTPIIVHFSAVLLICILFVVPTLTPISLSILLGIGSLFGLRYIIHIARRLRQQVKTAVLDSSDTFWHVTVPGGAYLLCFATATGVILNIDQILNVLGLALAGLLIASLRNTWDLFIWLAQQRPKP